MAASLADGYLAQVPVRANASWLHRLRLRPRHPSLDATRGTRWCGRRR